MSYLKKWYRDDYQKIVYAIGIAKGEYDKIGSFISPTLIILTPLKLFFPIIPWWVLPLALILATVSGYWFGEFLIKLGVPKKTAQLGNQNNPELMEILNWTRNANNTISRSPKIDS